MPSTTRRRLLIALGGLAGVVVLVLGGTWLYINVIQEDAPDPFALDTTSSDEIDDGDDDAPDTDGAASLDGTWTVASGSEAGYRVDEVLNGLDNTVVGRTTDVTGEVVVSDNTAMEAEVVVDMTTVTTDSDSRDSQFRGPIMNTEEYPTATFTLTEPVPLDDLASGSEPIEINAEGELTVRDVTREVGADLQIQLSGDAVDVAGQIPITFIDFEIEPPDLGFVSVEDDGLVEFLLTLSRE